MSSVDDCRDDVRNLNQTGWLMILLSDSILLLSEEADDDDDPEYNFLEDLDEPDLEDYRTDRAVQITSRCSGWGGVVDQLVSV